jgi:hypothetical protein
MARPRNKDLISRLADAGEEAIQRIGSAPGGDRVVGAVNGLRDRVDEMQKRLRGLDALEKRLATVERRLDKLDDKGKSASSSSSSSSSTRKKTT